MVLGDKDCKGDKILGGGFIFYFHPYLGEDFQFDEHIFQMGWFNHQPEDDEIRISLVAIFDKKKHHHSPRQMIGLYINAGFGELILGAPPPAQRS